jgi:hypothetical protein
MPIKFCSPKTVNQLYPLLKTSCYKKETKMKNDLPNEIADIEELKREAEAFRWLIAQPESTWTRIGAEVSGLPRVTLRRNLIEEARRVPERNGPLEGATQYD